MATAGIRDGEHGVPERPSLAAGSPEPLVERYDVALLDLDGVVYVGPAAVPGVPDALREVRHAGMRLGFVTNNASRTPDEVAAHLTEIGVPADPADVITSSQSAATVVAELLGPAGRVLAVGGPGVAAALSAAGLTVVHRAEDRPGAVVQGYGREVGWAQLAEAVVAVREGARHVATNADATVPSPRGPLPGNGALVGVVSAVTGQPPLVTGKPDPAMHAECVLRTGAEAPLVVGDRLDTDIEGAQRAGAASLLVLSGVTDPGTLLAAGPRHRPDHLAHDAAGVLASHPPVLPTARGWRCGSWVAGPTEAGGMLLEEISEDGEHPPTASDGLDWLRALCVAGWTLADGGTAARPVAGGESARVVLGEWGLL
ncbi:HAD-IIA family hydrolase [Blastococcus sp. CCUG 61487]|uniref:HAD-IIA family hydrolase n=1 Tax=Blastococcus sp. CCUG 61487 TaxID=1840703 RepID=UPI0010C15727|nr:HAD-IIA family hydrolase [Blastococcus sp. CCUG 61487]TKJ29409.1 HAD family hydrolase [Blastococcus sp. CCUG 61487]